MNGRIVIFGHDETLLQTRKWVLEKRFPVETAKNLRSLSKIIQERRIDLVMLCYSLTSEECDQVIDLLRAASPETRVLNLLDSADRSRCAAGHPTCSPLDGPELLIKSAQAMLGDAHGKHPI